MPSRPQKPIFKPKSDFWGRPDGKVKRAELMSMADHWLKGFIQRAVAGGMSRQTAEVDAREKIRKLLYRNSAGISNIPIPTFTKEEKRNLDNYCRRRNAKEALKRQNSHEAEVLERFGY